MNQSIKPNRTYLPNVHSKSTGGGGNFAQDSNFPKIGCKIFDIMKVHNKAIGKVKNFQLMMRHIQSMRNRKAL